MYNVSTTNRFDKDLKRCMKRGLNMQLIYDAILLLRTTGTLPPQYRPHQLKGDHKRTMGMPYSAQLANDLGTERQATYASVP